MFFRQRYRRIVFFFARVLTSLIFWDVLLPRLGLRSCAQRNRHKRLERAAVQYRQLAIDMGGVLIKVGQFLSARVDVLPDEITNELAGLQDEVPPEEFSDILRVLETEFNTPLNELFPEFNKTPVAAASLGQVHQAKLNFDEPTNNNHAPHKDNRSASVVVKIQRPDIESVIATDLAAIHTVGKWLQRYKPISKRANIPALIQEFSLTLYEEIDYLAEGKNAEIFASNFKHRQGVRVPAVVWSHTTRRVLTLEDVTAIKITDYESITAAGIDLAAVADRLFQTYLQQIFEDGFFHADPHPGNLFVSPQPIPPWGRSTDSQDSQNTSDWQLAFVDFGMVGHVPPNLRSGMREMAIAVGTRDAARMVKAFQIMDVLLPSANLELIEKAEAKMFEQFWGKSMTELKEISHEEMRDSMHEFRELMFDMPFQIPQDMILLGRCVAILSGMCTGLNPQFNVWEGLEPFAQQLIREEASSNLDIWLDELKNIGGTLLGYPRRIDNLLAKMEKGEMAVQTPQLEVPINSLQRAITRLTGGIIFAALLIAGIQVYLAGEVFLSGVLFTISGVVLLWILFYRCR
jgi:predicted unusual protein kinase regulating ubiquinone biosynthesis (AarF/ABC1/UbiB family)